MRFEYIKDFFQNLAESAKSLSPTNSKEVLFKNIRQSFTADTSAFTSTLTSLIALIVMAVLGVVGIALAALSLALMLVGCILCPKHRRSEGSPFGGDNEKASDSVLFIGLITGGFGGGLSLLGTLVQAFTLPFQIIALPFMLIGAAIKACFPCTPTQEENKKQNNDQSSTLLLSEFTAQPELQNQKNAAPSQDSIQQNATYSNAANPHAQFSHQGAGSDVSSLKSTIGSYNPFLNNI